MRMSNKSSICWLVAVGTCGGRANEVERLEAGSSEPKQILKAKHSDIWMLFYVMSRLRAAEDCRTNLRAASLCGVERRAHLGKVVDVQVAALFDGLLVAGRLSRLGRRSDERGGLQDEGWLGGRRLGGMKE